MNDSSRILQEVFRRSNQVQRFFAPASPADCRDRLLNLQESHPEDTKVTVQEWENGQSAAWLGMYLPNGVKVIEATLLMEAQAANVTMIQVMVHAEPLNELLPAFAWTIISTMICFIAWKAGSFIFQCACFVIWLYFLGILLFYLANWFEKRRRIHERIMHALLMEPIHLTDGDVF